MSDGVLKRRPTFFRYVVMMCLISFLSLVTYIKHLISHRSGFIPVSAVAIVGLGFYVTYSFESARRYTWGDGAVRTYGQWWFGIILGKIEEVRFADIISLDDGTIGVVDSNSRYPFTTIQITDGYTTLNVRTVDYYREGIQQLLRAIIEARADLPLSENLQAFVDGELDGYWPK